MLYRIFRKSNIRVSEIGFGCWGIGGGWGPLNDGEAIQSIRLSIREGVNFVDTALAYGHGHSEKLVARALKEINSPVTVATKIPPKNWVWPARHDSRIQDVFPKKWIIECTEKSLTNLGVECLDLQQFHVWSDAWTDHEEWKECIASLKQQGKIRYFGVSVNDHEPDSALKVVETGLVDTVQVIYNIFDQSPNIHLFPLCQKNHISVIARVPLDEGGLSGQLKTDTQFKRNDWRRDYFKGQNLTETCERADKIKKVFAATEIKTLAQGALKFCLSHPAVSTVIVGMRKRAHVKDNCSVSNGIYLDAPMLDELTKHTWRRNFYH